MPGLPPQSPGRSEADAKSASVEADAYRTPLKTSEDGASATLPQRSTERFSLLGVTWTDPAAKVTGQVEARTRSAATGEWTRWLPLDTEIDGRTEAGRAGVRGTTEPRWVGPSNGVEVRISAARGVKAGLPDGLRLDTAKSGAATAWKMTAYDRAGNTAAASVSGTPVILQETSAQRTGKWAVKSSSSYLGGKSLTSSAKNASLAWTSTGRSAAWVVSRAATSGQAYVYVDGKKVAAVDLKSASTKYRDAIWTRSWSTSAMHTVKIVVVGTKGRPALTTDGLVYLK
ncbi:hypothetical protein [Streptomyces cyaneofuscatus]|uniref:hypothetical protein n=1 Tax=Streptomyces cyaneofuscatus TaxID=66883 RepID=UPI0036556DE1